MPQFLVQVVSGSYLANPGFQEWWNARLELGRDDRDAAFVEYFDRRIDEAIARRAANQ